MNKLTPIVMLHYVSDEWGMDKLEPWNITTKSFIRLLDYFQEHNYKTIGFEDAVDHDPTRSVIITFDDCPKHLWHFVIPELCRRNMKAVFYIPTAYIGGIDEWNVAGTPSVPIMDRNDIKRLVEVGMEVGTHSHRHIWLEKESVDTAIAEILSSKQILEDITGRPVQSIAYPYGSMPKQYYRNMKRAGLSFGVGVATPWENKYSLGRWIYSNDMDEVAIQTRLQEEYVRKVNFNDVGYVAMIALYRVLYEAYAFCRHKVLTRRLLKRIYRDSPAFFLTYFDIVHVWSDRMFFSSLEKFTVLETHIF